MKPGFGCIRRRRGDAAGSRSDAARWTLPIRPLILARDLMPPACSAITGLAAAAVSCESACYCAIAGEMARLPPPRVLEVHGPQTPALALDRLNDEPFDSSLVDMHSAPRSEPRAPRRGRSHSCGISCGRTPARPDGSFYFDNQPNMLDQFTVNKNLATGDARSRPTPPWRKSSNRRPWSIQVSTQSKKASPNCWAKWMPPSERRFRK
jgi:hypothetical protein